MRIRELFIPRKGFVLYFPDYSQIEVWLAAYISKDPVMMNALANGLDMHDKFARRFFGGAEDYAEKREKYRKITKMGTFCTIYGGGVSALQGTLGCTREDAEQFRSAFFQTYEGLAMYAKDLATVAEQHGFVVNPFGRRFVVGKDIAYKSLNYMIQGSAADVMKRAMINVDNLLKARWPHTRILMTIHDELCIEVPKKFHSKMIMREIVQAMRGDFHKKFGMPEPFNVSMAWTDTRWSEKKEIEIW